MVDSNADPRYGRFGLRTDCPRCGAHLPVNGPAESVDCAECGATVSLPDGLLVDLLSDFEDQWPRPEASGMVVRGDQTWRWTAAPAESAHCAKCDAVLPPPRPDEDTVSCPACAILAPVASLPADLTQRIETARHAIGGHDDLSRPASPPEPVALQCPQCGAGLSIDVDRERITRCDHCNSQVHLPDSVWRLLHPPREVREWFVRFEGERVAARKAREKAEAAARKRAEKKARAEEKAARKAEQDAARAAEKARVRETREAEERWRNRVGRVGLAVSWILTGSAVVAMILPVMLWAAPGVLSFVGVEDGAAIAVTQSLLVAGAIGFVVAWIFGHALAAWRARLSIPGTLFFSSLLLTGLVVPVVGVFGGLFASLYYLYGRFPTPGGEQFKNFRHRTWSGMPMAVLLPVGGAFITVALGVTFDMTVWEMLAALGED